jgi:hypothetical protein
MVFFLFNVGYYSRNRAAPAVTKLGLGAKKSAIEACESIV